MADIHIAFHGSIVIATGVSETGSDWLNDNLDENAMRWGQCGFVIEPRYLDPIVEGARTDGLEVA